MSQLENLKRKLFMLDQRMIGFSTVFAPDEAEVFSGLQVLVKNCIGLANGLDRAGDLGETPDQPTGESQEDEGPNEQIVAHVTPEGDFIKPESVARSYNGDPQTNSGGDVIGSFSEVSDEDVRAAGGEPESESAYDLRATRAYDFGPAEETENPI